MRMSVRGFPCWSTFTEKLRLRGASVPLCAFRCGRVPVGERSEGRGFSPDIRGQLCLPKVSDAISVRKPQREHSHRFHRRASPRRLPPAGLQREGCAVNGKPTRWPWCSSNQEQAGWCSGSAVSVPNAEQRIKAEMLRCGHSVSVPGGP